MCAHPSVVVGVHGGDGGASASECSVRCRCAVWRPREPVAIRIGVRVANPDVTHRSVEQAFDSHTLSPSSPPRLHEIPWRLAHPVTTLHCR